MDARFTPAERQFYYRQWQQRHLELIDEQIVAIEHGLARAFTKHPTYHAFSDKYTRAYAQHQQDVRAFPYDVPYLSRVAVNRLVHHSEKYNLPDWTHERAAAHLQADDLVKKRASCSAFLWRHYQEARQHGKPLTLHTLEQWATVEKLEELFQASEGQVAGHVKRVAEIQGIAPQTYWRTVLAQRGLTLEALRNWHVELIQHLSSQ